LTVQFKKEESYVSCNYCGKGAIYKCAMCGKLLCPEHVKLGALCLSSEEKTKLAFTVRKLMAQKEKSQLRELVKRLWGEEEQLAFDRRFTVTELPAYVARVNKSFVGFTSFAEVDDAVIVVALGVLPHYQGFGVGSRLIGKVQSEAKKLRKRRMLVSTSNDDLPALAFYQSLGFQIFEVKPNVIAEKHGTIRRGIGGLLVRDELRLQKTLD
jgi:ribosomal protein S18 acetylase RimI-like enzyme